MREVLILNCFEVQIVQVRWDVGELLAAIVVVAGLGTLATCPVVGKEEGTEIVSLVKESQVFGLLLIQLG